jgi:hypothetical protein
VSGASAASLSGIRAHAREFASNKLQLFFVLIECIDGS